MEKDTIIIAISKILSQKLIATLRRKWVLILIIYWKSWY